MVAYQKLAHGTCVNQMFSLHSIRIVLVETSHPGNIGSVARAMKNMGLSQLYLVSPHHFPHPQATALASGADDILEQAVVTSSLSEALVSCERVYASSARIRHLPIPNMAPREAAAQIIQASHAGSTQAILFGRERIGLTNDELADSHVHITIPTSEASSSLNLSQAVMVMAYELCLAAQENQSTEVVGEPSTGDSPMATAELLHGFYAHLEKTLFDIEFLDPNHPKLLMQRLKRVFNRADLDEREVNILRGILSSMNRISQLFAAHKRTAS